MAKKDFSSIDTKRGEAALQQIRKASKRKPARKKPQRGPQSCAPRAAKAARLFE